MKIARVILFTGQIDAMSKFYGDVLCLKLVASEKGWQELAAGGARIALHSGASSRGR
jgi:catechol 2,3-dioxygenase-like lactoylglutathione lyase family enzyme